MAQQPPITERAYSRAPARCDATFIGDDTSGTGVVCNISLGGFFVETNELPEKGVTITLRFSLPPGVEEVTVTGKVVRVEDDFEHSRRRGIGIALTRASQTVLQSIEGYVRRMRRIFRSLKIELETADVNRERTLKLIADTHLDLPEDPEALKRTVEDTLLQFRLRGRSKLRKIGQSD